MLVSSRRCRTPEGKAKVAQNAVKHGLLAQEPVIKGEDPEEFAYYRDQMLEELAPAGLMESLLAARIIGLSWRLRRDREAGEEGQEVSGRRGGASREPPSDFTLDNLLAAIAALEEPPHGVATNAPAVPSCETKPISPGSRVDQVPCGTEVMADSVPDGLGENKANSPEPGADGSTVGFAGEPVATPNCLTSIGI